jgi:acyl carrier protein
MPSTATPISAADAIEAVLEILHDRGIDWGEVTADTNLRNLGLDSVELAELFMILEERVGSRLDPESAADVVLVEDLTQLRILEAIDG